MAGAMQEGGWGGGWHTQSWGSALIGIEAASPVFCRITLLANLK